MMDPTNNSPSVPRNPDYTLDLFADPTFAKDIVKAVLHTIFFHRYFTPIAPIYRDLLDLTLPAIDDVDLETLIEQRAGALVRELGSEGRTGGMGGMSSTSTRGQLAVQFYEKVRPKKKPGWFGNQEDPWWERWTLDVTLATPRTETDVIKVRRAMEKSLYKTTMKIIDIVNRDKEHIPAITTTEGNPFPYQILVNPKTDGWGQRIGIF